MFNLKRFDKSYDSLKTATLINAGSKYLTVIFNLLFNALLARILTPEDYGIVAVLTVFTNFFALFSDMGIGTAVIQNKELEKKDENRIFTFSLFLGLILAVIFSVFSFFLVYLYNNTLYYILGPVLSISLAFNTFNMVPNACLMKQKRFMLVGLRTIVCSLVCYLIAFVIALMGGKYYSIVLQSVCHSILVFLLNWKNAKTRIDFFDIRKSMKKIWSFSSYQLGFNIINYFSRNLDNLLTGYFFGSKALGYYDKAYRLMRYPVDSLSSVISPAMQPILSDHQNDVKYVMQKYNKVAKLLAVLAVYVMGVCFFASKEIVLLFFGKQWEGAVKCFHILSISLLFQIVGGISGSIYQSVNRTKAMFWSGIIGSTITVSAIILGVYFGTIESLAFCYTIGFILNFIKSQIFLAKFCFLDSVWNLIKIYIPELIILLVIFVLMSFVPTLNNLSLSFLLKFSVCTAIYLIMLVLTKEGSIIIELLPAKIKKVFKH